MLPPDLATDLASEIRADIDRAKAAILDSLLARLDRLAAVVPLDLPEPDAHVDAEEDKAPAPEPVDADEYRAMVRPAAPAPAPEPEPEEFAVVRAAPAAVEAPVEPPAESLEAWAARRGFALALVDAALAAGGKPALASIPRARHASAIAWLEGEGKILLAQAAEAASTTPHQLGD